MGAILSLQIMLNRCRNYCMEPVDHFRPAGSHMVRRYTAITVPLLPQPLLLFCHLLDSSISCILFYIYIYIYIYILSHVSDVAAIVHPQKNK